MSFWLGWGLLGSVWGVTESQFVGFVKFVRGCLGCDCCGIGACLVVWVVLIGYFRVDLVEFT